MSEKELRRYSRVVVDGDEQAPSRAMLRGVGFEDADFSRPQVGVASTWAMTTPCNMHIDRLAEEGAGKAEQAAALFADVASYNFNSVGFALLREEAAERSAD